MFFVAEAVDGGRGGRADMIQKQYLQRVMSVQRAIEGAMFTSSVDGKVGEISVLLSPVARRTPTVLWLYYSVLFRGGCLGEPVASLTDAWSLRWIG